MLRVVVSGEDEGVRVVDTIVVGGAGGGVDGDGVSRMVTRSVADVVLGVVGVVVVVEGPDSSGGGSSCSGAGGGGCDSACSGWGSSGGCGSRP